MTNNPAVKRLPYIALAVAFAAAGLLLLKPPAGGTSDRVSPAMVDPALAQPLPEVMQLRPVVRERIVREVIEGRRSLLAAAALFGELNQLDGQPLDRSMRETPVGKLRLPGRTLSERLCQQVECWVRVALRDNPRRSEAVMARLEAQYRNAPRDNGDIRLPDPASLESVEQLFAQARARQARL
ncbi:MAG TPA: hypothetical protein VL371_26210 [Gemmataceae bacterium]|jgi:hypothetical protein|nr:hypothetical protein [Gemmataceae bacterium]